MTLEHEHLVLVTHNSNDQAPMVFATETGGDGVWKPLELNDGWDNVIEYGAFVVIYLHTRRLARQGILLFGLNSSLAGGLIAGRHVP